MSEEKDPKVPASPSLSDAMAAAAKNSGLGKVTPGEAPTASALLGAMGGIRGLVESIVPGLGFLIVFISCHQGLNTKEGAVGVGRAPTESVVLGSLAILIVNFFLSFALNIIFPGG